VTNHANSFESDFGKYNPGPEQLTPEHMTQTIMGWTDLRDWLMHYRGDCFRTSLETVPLALQIVNLALLFDTGLAEKLFVLHKRDTLLTLHFMDSFQCPSAVTSGCFRVKVRHPSHEVKSIIENGTYATASVYFPIIWRRCCT